VKRVQLFLVSLFALIMIVGCSSNTSSDGDGEEAEANETGEPGGTLNVAYPTQPQTIDPQGTTAEATRDAARLIYESLVTVNENYEVVPQLAESYEVSDDRKTVEFKLREGITFHNGDEMKAEDVIASMEKLAEVKSGLSEYEWEEVDDYNVT